MIYNFSVKILSSSEIRQADAFTILHEPIASIDLMERAARKCFEWIIGHFDLSMNFKIFCGTGNNGGDGLVICRLMLEHNMNVAAFIIGDPVKATPDFRTNAERLHAINPSALVVVHEEKFLPPVSSSDVVIDALFGTGLSRPAEGLAAACIRHINRSGAAIVAIDVPSGLFADEHTTDESVVHAQYTLTFQSPKLAFFFPENSERVGKFEVLDIGLSAEFIEQVPENKFAVDQSMVRKFITARKTFDHKGKFGHALLIAGSEGKMGAAVLAARACLRSGSGLLTVHVPKSGYRIIQTSVPEAMAEMDQHEQFFSSVVNLEKYNALAIGCGLGQEEPTQQAMKSVLENMKGLAAVLDADAINMLSSHPDWLSLLPEKTILTPHFKEFERIAGPSENDFDRHQRQLDFSLKHKLIIILKGAYTCISFPDGRAYFNLTGNPGMAKGGSGDALTGVILGLLAQHYPPENASIAGVYLHGLAGDLAAKKTGMHALLASDLVDSLGEAFLEITNS